MRYYEETIHVDATPAEVFSYVDDFRNFSAHMNKSSVMMAGSKMKTILDRGMGQKVGSHVKMKGKVLGVPIYLDEVITERTESRKKVWETVGTPRLLVIGKYILGFEITPDSQGSKLKVFIHYAMPTGLAKILGLIVGNFYAKWCATQMTRGVTDHFQS